MAHQQPLPHFVANNSDIAPFPFDGQPSPAPLYAQHQQSQPLGQQHPQHPQQLQAYPPQQLQFIPHQARQLYAQQAAAAGYSGFPSTPVGAGPQGFQQQYHHQQHFPTPQGGGGPTAPPTPAPAGPHKPGFNSSSHLQAQSASPQPPQYPHSPAPSNHNSHSRSPAQSVHGQSPHAANFDPTSSGMQGNFPSPNQNNMQAMQRPPMQQQPQQAQPPMAQSKFPSYTPPANPAEVARERERVKLCLEINTEILQHLVTLQQSGKGGMLANPPAQSPPSAQKPKAPSPEYVACLRALQSNFQFCNTVQSEGKIQSGQKTLPGPAIMTSPIKTDKLNALYEKARELWPGWRGILGISQQQQQYQAMMMMQQQQQKQQRDAMAQAMQHSQGGQQQPQQQQQQNPQAAMMAHALMQQQQQGQQGQQGQIPMGMGMQMGMGMRPMGGGPQG